MNNIPQFNGSDYVPVLDHERLGRQFTAIFNLMADGKWRTLREIEQATSYSQASISAQLRHMRKERFGAHTVEKQRRQAKPDGEPIAPESGLFEYRLIVSLKSQTI